MYEIILYDTEDGKCPMQELLDSLEPKLLAKTLRSIDLLEKNGPLLREPYSKSLEDGIFELRTKQGSNIKRVLYFFFIGKKVILTNGLVKTSNKTHNDPKELASMLAERTHSQVVQVIGKKIVLYKEGKDKNKKIVLP